MTYLLSDSHIFREDQIANLDVSRLSDLIVTITLKNGLILQASDIRAIELVMTTYPSAFEGLRMRWPKLVWAFHNIVAHPLMHIMVWLRMPKLAFKLHNVTVPRPIGKKLKKPS
jgi:hypothetical protein